MDGDGELGAVTNDEQVSRGWSRGLGGIGEPLVRTAGLIVEHLNWLGLTDRVELEVPDSAGAAPGKGVGIFKRRQSHQPHPRNSGFARGKLEF